MQALFLRIKNVLQWLLASSWKVKIVGLLILVVLGWFIVSQVVGASQTPQYQTAQVERGSIISSVTQSGNISSASEINVTSPTDGFIEEAYVKNGDVVAAGQNLFKVKSTATPQQLAAAYASYQTALNSAQTSEQNKLTLQATLEKDRKAVLDAQNDVDFKNNNTTNPSTKNGYTELEKQSIDSALTSARETFTADEKKYTQADTNIGATKSSLNAAWLSYQATQDSVVTAPIDGTIANFSGSVGSNVSASSGNNSANASSANASSTTNATSSTSSTGSTVLVIGNFSQLVIKTPVSEIDAPKIHPGQKATVTIDAFPDKTYVGTVESIDTIGTISSGVVTYNAYIALVSPPSDILSGMSASAVIQLERHDDVLIVPSSAIQTNNGQSFVRVMKNGKVNQVTVETGLASDTDTEITSGLSEGDTIITSAAVQNRTTGTQTTSPFSGLGGGRGFGGGFGGGGGAVRRTGGQ